MRYASRLVLALGITLALGSALAIGAKAQTTYQIDFLPGADGISAVAFATGQDLNNDGLITGDGTRYHFYDGIPNEWSDVSISFFDNGSRVDTYHSVLGGVIPYQYFLLGIDTLTSSVENIDVGMDPDYYAVNVPSQGYDPNGEWFNDTAGTEGVFGGMQVGIAPPVTEQTFRIDFLPGTDGISATAFATGTDLNHDGLITGDAGHYNFYNGMPNEWSDASITFYQNGTPLGTYQSVQGGTISYDFFVLGIDTFSFALVNGDIGMDPDFYAINVPSQGYDPNGEWYNDVANTFGVFGGTQVTALSVVPEPGTLALLTLGLLTGGIGFARWKGNWRG